MSYRGRGRRFGDVDMSQNNSSNNNTRIQGPGQQLNQLAQRTMEQNAIGVEVRNWQGATKDELVAFLSRKTRIPLLNSSVEGDAVVGYVKNQQEAESLQKWSGVRFAGNSLRIQVRSATTLNTIEMLKRVLARRYNAQMKLLDLTSILSDQELQSQGSFSISAQSKMFPALMKLASQEKFAVESVDLSANNLEDLQGVTSLAQTFPNLINLALTNNRISKLRSLETWKNKFKSLRELYMVNNPITTDPQYKAEVLKTFPRLILIDGVVVRDESKLKAIYEIPVPKKQFFFEDAEIQQLSTQFIQNYLQFWDSDRSQLLALYTPDSQFSLSVDSSVPNDAQATDVSFGYYIPISRNLSRVSSERSREQRLGKGQEQIFKLFKNLPKTKHKLMESPESYSMEAWRYSQVNGFIISLHGEFQETGVPEIDANNNSNNSNSNQRGHRRGAVTMSSASKLTPKSFDRVFVIVPSPNGLIIASDLLIVRPIANPKSWIETQQSTPTTAPETVPSSSSSQQLPPSTSSQSPAPMELNLPPNLQPQQREILTRLMMETKLNLQFTMILCEQTQWNYDMAIQSFKTSHQNGQIPPEAFQ